MKQYPVLRAVMKDKRATMADLADYAGITLQSAYNKLKGRTDWTIEEAKKIKERLGYRDNIDILFFCEVTKNEEAKESHRNPPGR